ncbi:hypothetical protein JCM19236_4793 [Vibrio sp. JCM 19236]|nr:hypothetical protein JCM19236_4793 [Vibrio sp. JCM 19236]
MVSFDGQETSSHLAYGGNGTEHQLEGLSPTSDEVQVAFVYVDLDTGDTASTDIAVSVVAASSTELTLPFDSYYTEQTLMLPEKLSRSETGFSKVRWELSESNSAVLSQNKRQLIPLSSSPITLIATTSTLQQHHFDLMPTSSPIVDIEIIHQAPLNHMIAIAHHQDGATTNATHKVKWHSDAKEVLAIDHNGRFCLIKMDK